MAQLDPDTLEHLATGGLLLTGNRRQSRFLFARHAEAMLAAGSRCWPTPGIMPLDAWLAEAFRQAALEERAPARRLLDEQASLWLWRDAVVRDAPVTLQDPMDLARLARRAWLALRLHGGDCARLAAMPLAGDQQLLLRWMRRIETRFEELEALDAGLLRLHVFPLLSDVAPGAVLLCGVDEATPGLAALRPTLARRSLLREPGWFRHDARVYAHAAPDADAETEAALDWLRDRLQRDPEGHYGLIVPDLDQRREDLERELSSVLQPSLELPGTLDHERIFDMAGGRPFAAQGVVATALDLLGLGPGPVPFAKLTHLLRSRFLAGSDREAGARALLDVDLRQRGRDSVPFADLAALARSQNCPQWADLLEAHAILVRAPGPPETLDVQVRHVGRVLASWGWPGPGALTSDVHQVLEEWQARLGQLAAEGPLAGRLEWRTALAELKRLCRAPFQPERGLPRLLVLGSLEDVGVPLDGLWVQGLSADRWPRSATPDELLPIVLQRELGMAAATPAGRLAQAQRVQAAWRQSVGELVLSWPRRRNDAAAAPSWLVPQPAADAATAASPRRARMRFEARQLESLRADPAPPLDPARTRGGSKLFELQARCPFRAFAELRLRAGRLAEPEPGIPMVLRGQVLHEALRRLWSEWQGSAALRALDAAQRQARVQRAVSQAAARFELAAFGSRTAGLEVEWQCAAVAHLLDLDLQRADFSVVATEAGYETTFAGLPLSLRIDRVDRVAERLLLIDYKTSRRAAARDWAGARPDAPQLPLYALTHAGNVAGIAFAVAARDGARYCAVAADAQLMGAAADVSTFECDEGGTRPSDWSELRARWRATLSELAAAHASGEAAVDPRRPDTCRDCHLMMLCRIRHDANSELARDDGAPGAEGSDRDAG